MKYNILLVEDDKQIREVIADYISEKAESMILETAADGSTGLSMFQENDYDLILLDIMLPGIDGFSIMREIRKSKDVPVIFLTARSREDDKLYGYELGCDDYICKPFSLAELYAKMNALLKRSKGMVMNTTISCGHISIDYHSQTAFVNGNPIYLAPKEYDLLSLFLHYPEYVYSRDMLLDKVWGADYFGTDRVVDNHIKKLRKSLGSAGSQIKTIISKGYKITENA